MRRQRENSKEKGDQSTFASLLPIQARSNNKQSASSSWTTSTFVPSSTCRNNNENQRKTQIEPSQQKVAPWSQLADAIKPRQEQQQQQQQEEAAARQHLCTGLAYHRDCANHIPRRHPIAVTEVEIPERTTFTMKHIQVCGLDKLCENIPVIEATYEQLIRAHDPGHVQCINGTVIHGLDCLPHLKYSTDIFVSQGTARAARLAAGGVTEAALKVARGELQNAMCIVRPPGHHCSGTKPSGFCFFNNVAVAARAAQAEVEGVNRVLIVDWDVHHGDGTEAVFYEDPSVCVISVHQHHFGKGHVFHRPNPEDMPGVIRRKKKKVIKKEEEEEDDEFNLPKDDQPQQAEQPNEAATADDLLALFGEDENFANIMTALAQQKEKSRSPQLQQQQQAFTEHGAENVSPLQRILEQAAEAAKQKEDSTINTSQQQQQQHQDVPPAVPPQGRSRRNLAALASLQELVKKEQEQESQTNDDQAVDFLANVFGADKVALKSGKEEHENNADDDDESSKGTSSLNSQKLFSSDGEDDDSSAFDSSNEEEGSENDKELDLLDGVDSDEDSDREVLSNAEGEIRRETILETEIIQLSALESHTGTKFLKSYKRRKAPFYPGTGHIDRVGSGEGRGKNINVPWPCTNFGDIEYLRILNELIVPVANEFKPDLILVSCGFDCISGDLLGEMKVSPSGIFLMTSLLSEKVNKKVVVALEGGYMLRNVALCSEAALRALLQFSSGRPAVSKTSEDKEKERGENVFAEQQQEIPPSTMLFDQTSRLIEEVKSFHGPYWQCLRE